MNVKHFLLFSLSAVLAYTFIPLCLIFFLIPLWVVRKLTISLSRFNNNLLSPLSLTSCLTAVDKIYSKPLAIIVPVVYLDGFLTLDSLQDRMVKVTEKFPELNCCLHRWNFCFFWRKLKNLDSVRDQVIECLVESEEEFRKVVEGLVSKPFEKGKPLWEIVLFPNYQEAKYNAKSVYALRVAHCLADGVALNALIKGIEDPNTDFEEALIKLNSRLEKRRRGFVYYLKLIFLPAMALYTILSAFDSNAWTLRTNGRSWKMVHHESEPLELDWIKSVARLKGRSFTTIIVEAFTAAFRKVLVGQGNPRPKDMHVTYSWPKKGHPGTLTNHAMGITFRLPISIASREERLEIISKNFKNWQETPLALGNYFLQWSYGLFTNFTNTAPFNKFQFCTFILSNFMFVSKPGTVLGSKMTHLNILCGTQIVSYSLLASCFSFDGKITIFFTGDTALFDKPTLIKLTNFVVYEIKDMEKG